MLLIWLQKIRIRSKSSPVHQALMEAERRCKLYDQFLKAAREGDLRTLRLLVEAADFVPYTQGRVET